jgi:rifampicin phosphotransferase
MNLTQLYELWVKISSITDKLSYINAENDFLLMHYLKSLRNKVKSEHSVQSILNEISTKNPISNRQNTDLNNILDKIRFLKTKFDHRNELVYYIHTSPDALDLRQIITLYLADFRGRFPQELNLYNDDTSLISIENFVDLSENTAEKQSTERKITAQKNYHFTVSRTIKNISKFLFYREKNRLLRARVFNLYRDIIIATSDYLTQLKIIDAPKDIHYLSIDEIWSYINCNSINFNLKGLIQLRKKDYINVDQIERWGSINIQDFYAGVVNVGETNTQDGVDFVGNCNGKIVGTLVALDDLYKIDTSKTNEKYILLAKQLDPGMVLEFSDISGIVVEFGGVLSHAAIISREMGIPALIGYKNAYSNFKSGDMVEVDSDLGIIQRLT